MVATIMLTILYPEAKLLIASYQGGLLPIRVPGDEKLSLVVKAGKDMILAAKLHRGFSFYLPAMPSQEVVTTSLITAFFDDSDQPLTITSPLFQEDKWTDGMLEILRYDEVDIYFFDDQNYEWLSYRATLEDGGSCLISKPPIHLLGYHPLNSKGINEALQTWFGQRTPDDDTRAIRVEFQEALSPEDIFITDMTVETNAYQGSKGFRTDSLVRDEPGGFQERDISACLLRAFEPEKVMMGPRRKDTFKEILDHLVLTDDLAILIQAKDSPNNQISLSRDLDRKRRAAHNQIGDAIKQIKGVARYFGRQPIADLVVDGADVKIQIGNRRIMGLAIVREMFDDEAPAYALACAKMSHLSGGGMVMDYSSFHAFTHHFCSEGAFVAALTAMVDEVRTSGIWSKPKHVIMDSVLDRIEEQRAQSAHDG